MKKKLPDTRSRTQKIRSRLLVISLILFILTCGLIQIYYFLIEPGFVFGFAEAGHPVILFVILVLSFALFIAALCMKPKEKSKLDELLSNSPDLGK